ncbi:MAG: hypothetical protein ACRD4Q_05690 [Candidatus Acidiferrales bacterium]
MPSEKAKDNKALIAQCSACGKTLSTETMVALTGREHGRVSQYPVCINCADGGWRPPGFDGIYSFRPA